MSELPRLPRLLVVDDQIVVLSVIRRALQGRFAIDVTTSGTEALTMIRASEYALVLTDLSMPGLSGLELVEVLAREAPNMVSRIVVMTATSASAEVVRLGELGVQVLFKPFGSTELLMMVGGYIARAGGDR